MSTISRIAMKQDDNTYKSIYCHSDGYLEHNGVILYTYYKDKIKVEDLIKLGDISKLGKEVSPDSSKPHNFKEQQDDVTVAYHRDRGEKFHSKDFLTREELIKYSIKSSENILYVYEDGVWKYIDTMHKNYDSVIEHNLKQELIKRNYIFNPLKENINKRKEVADLLVKYIKKSDPYKFSLYFGTDEFAFEMMNILLSNNKGVEDTMEKLYFDIYKLIFEGAYNNAEKEALAKEALSLMLELNDYTYTLYKAKEFEMER